MLIKTFFTIFLLFFLLFVFFHRIFLFDEVFYCCDNLLINIPSKVFLAESIKSGFFPLWNPYIFSGAPFLADINIGSLFPTNLLYFVTHPFQALTTGIVLHVFIVLCGMYWCLRALGQSFFSALCGAIVFGFSGTIMTYTGNAPMIQSASLLPWVFGSWVLLTKEKSNRYVFSTILIMSLQILSGHPQITFYTFLYCVFYYILFSKKMFVKKIGEVSFVLFMTGLVSAVQVIPFFELAQLSTRLSGDFQSATVGSLNPLSLIRFAFPSVVGSLKNGTDFWQGGSVYGYIGILPLFIILFAFKKTKESIFFLSTAIISLFLSFGKYTPVYSLFFYLVPGIALFRVPSHFLLLYTFSFVILFAKTVDNANFQSSLNRVNLFASGIFGFFGLTGMFFQKQVIEIIISVSEQNQKLQGKVLSLTPEGISIVFQDILLNALFFAFIFIAYSYVHSRLFKDRKSKLLFIVLIFLDLFFYSNMTILTISKTHTDSWLKKIVELSNEIKKSTGGYQRLYIAPEVYAASVKRRVGEAQYLKESEWQISILRPNTGMLSHLSYVDGYAALVQKRYQDFFGEKSTDPTGVFIGDVSKAPFGQLAVGVVGSRKDSFRRDNNFLQMFSTEEISFYKNVTAQSMVEFVNNEKKITPLPNVRWAKNFFEVLYESTESGKITLSQNSYPGWKVMLDDIEVPFEAGQTHLTVIAPSGSHKLKFLFAPASVTASAVFSGIGLFICTFISLQKFVWKRIKGFY